MVRSPWESEGTLEVVAGTAGRSPDRTGEATDGRKSVNISHVVKAVISVVPKLFAG